MRGKYKKKRLYAEKRALEQKKEREFFEFLYGISRESYPFVYSIYGKDSMEFILNIISNSLNSMLKE